MAGSAGLLTTAQTALQLDLTEGALAQMRYTGKGPKFLKLGGRSVRYRQSDIDEWLESRVRTRTDDVGVAPLVATAARPAARRATRGRTAATRGSGDAA